MASGFLAMGAYQYFRGYCILFAFPQVETLNDADGPTRTQFLADMATAGDAVLRVTGCRRMNYSIYGNLDHFLHAHIWPRYDSEDERYIVQPPFSLPVELREAPEHAYDPAKYADLQRQIREALEG